MASSATTTDPKDAAKDHENENENPGTPTPKSVRKKAATPKSAKSKAGTDGGGDGATDPKTSTAAPRMATFSKSTLAKFQAADAAAAGGDGDEQSQPETPTSKKGGRAKKAVDPKTDIADMLASKKRARGGKAKVDAIDEEGGVKDSEEPAGEASPKKKRAATGKAKAVKAEDSADEDAESNGGEGSEALKEDEDTDPDADHVDDDEAELGATE